jgi:hypothetical protein
MLDTVKNFRLSKVQISRRLLLVLSIILMGAVAGTGAMGVLALHKLNDKQADSLDTLRVLSQAVDSARLAQIYFGLQLQDLSNYMLAPPQDPARDNNLKDLAEHTQTVQAMIKQAGALTFNQARLVSQVASDNLAIEVATEAGAISGLVQDHVELEGMFRSLLDRTDRLNGTIPYPDYLVMNSRVVTFNVKLNRLVDNLMNINVRLRTEIEQEGNRTFHLYLWIFGAVSGVTLILIGIFLSLEHITRARIERMAMEYWAEL